jgi:hypothetical protein
MTLYFTASFHSAQDHIGSNCPLLRQTFRSSLISLTLRNVLPISGTHRRALCSKPTETPATNRFLVPRCRLPNSHSPQYISPVGYLARGIGLNGVHVLNLLATRAEDEPGQASSRQFASLRRWRAPLRDDLPGSRFRWHEFENEVI